MPHDRETDLTPAEEQVRRLLADARHTEPMPEDVAARLDGVLAGLASDDGAGTRRTSDGSAARAADLAAARRRRTVRNLLVAAAAVVAIGVGLNEADLTVSSDDANSGMSSGVADAAGEAAPEAALESEGGRDAAKDDDRPPRENELTNGSAAFGYQSGSFARLSEDRFGTQVRRLQRDTWSVTMYDAPADGVDGLFSLGQSLRAGCPTRDWGAGLLVPVRYDGDLGALVFREASGETQVVDLFLCGSDEPARSITLPSR